MIIDVVVPAYKVRQQVCDVVRDVLAHAHIRTVFVIDDACPDGSGAAVRAAFAGEPRVQVMQRELNGGVGAATMAGYAAAFGSGAEAVVKIDGDGQMRASLIPLLTAPVESGAADYAKGNRFFVPRELRRMPAARLLGNAVLSLVNKFSSGYWSVIDPTNGFTALHRAAWEHLEPARLSPDYFFESDLLYQLGIVRAVVQDVPMPVIYRGEASSLRIGRVLWNFPGRYLVRFFKRIAYQYFIRDFNAGSLEILAGLPLFASGLILGSWQWIANALRDRATPTGTLILVSLLLMMGFQLLLSALNYDIAHEPRVPLNRRASR